MEFTTSMRVMVKFVWFAKTLLLGKAGIQKLMIDLIDLTHICSLLRWPVTELTIPRSWMKNEEVLKIEPRNYGFLATRRISLSCAL